MDSSKENEITEKEKKNYKLRSDAAKLIVQRLKQDFSKALKKTKYRIDIEKVSLFTGVSLFNVCKYVGHENIGVSGIESWEDKYVKKTTTSVVSYLDLKYAIHDHYVNKRVIPTKEILVNILQTLRKKYDIKLLENDLKINGFIWLKVPNTNKCIVYEKPDQLFDRQKHFRTVIRHRGNGKDIIYLEERVCKADLNEYPPDISSVQNYVLAAATVQGVYIKCYYRKNIIQAYIDFVTTQLNWTIPNNTLIITSHKRYLDAVYPNESSTAEEMIDWLKRNEVPYSGVLPEKRYNLYEHIKMLRNKPAYGKSDIEKLLKTFGYSVIKYNSDNFGQMYHTCFFKNSFNTLSSRIASKIINETTVETLNNYYIHDEQVRLFYNANDWERLNMNMMHIETVKAVQDVEFEIVVDQVLTMAKYKGLDPEHVKTLDDIVQKPEKEKHARGTIVFCN